MKLDEDVLNEVINTGIEAMIDTQLDIIKEEASDRSYPMTGRIARIREALNKIEVLDIYQTSLNRKTDALKKEN